MIRQLGFQTVIDDKLAETAINTQDGYTDGPRQDKNSPLELLDPSLNPSIRI